MSSFSAAGDVRATSLPAASRAYWIATGVFCAIFVVSGLSYFVDPGGAGDTFERLGYPDRLVYPVGALKLLGVATILIGRWRTLTLFALAGFGFDMLLALQAHIAESDPQGFLAAAGLVAWLFAFLADRRRFGPPSASGPGRAA